MTNHVLAFLKDLFYLKYLPKLSNDASFGLLFLFGLLTSIHCIGMCGGIILTQCVHKNEAETAEGKPQSTFLPIVLYNAGRIISYTIIGGIVGGLGQVLTISGVFKGVIPIIGGIFMIIMAVNFLGIFPILRHLNISMPRFIVKRIRGGNSNRSPLIVGLLTGLMPCGPLQMIQLYALSTRSVVYGATAAFVFTIGTIPSLFAFGAFSTIISKKFSKYILKFSAGIVAVLGIVMIGRGLALTGISFPSFSGTENKADSYVSSVVQGDVQSVTTSIGQDSFPAIQVTKGIKVRWTIKVDESVYNDCNSEMQIPTFNIDKKFVVGDNVVEFTPDKEGEFVYSCWMGMIKSKIKVVQNEAVKQAVASKNTTQKDSSATIENKGNTTGNNSSSSTDNSTQTQSGDPNSNKTQSISGWINEKLTPGGHDSEAQQKTQTWVGWIFDRDCIGINPASHTKACNIMGSCYASGLGIIPYVQGKSFDTYTATNDFVVFDGNSRAVAKAFIESLPDDWKTNISIKVTGYSVNNIPTNADETNVPEEDASKVDHCLSGIRITSIEAYYIDGVSTNKLPTPNVVFPKK